MKLCLAALAGTVFSCALAQDMPELTFKGSVEVRSAYLSRGKVVDARPFSAQFASGIRWVCGGYVDDLDGCDFR